MNYREATKLGLVLAAYASVACGLLAATALFTRDAQAKQERIKKEQALKEIFPELDSIEDLSLAEFIGWKEDAPMSAGGTPTKLVEVTAVRQNAVLIGVAVLAEGKSYGGKARVLTGVGLDARVAGVKILELADTPGLGQNAMSPTYYVDRKTKTTWYGQFKGKAATDPFNVAKAGGAGDVVAITASTISSKSISAIVKASAAPAAEYLAKQAQAMPPQANPAATAAPATAAPATAAPATAAPATAAPAASAPREESDE